MSDQLSTATAFQASGYDQNPASGEMPIGTAPRSRGTILIVDDEPKLARGLARALEADGYVVKTMDDAEEASRLLQHESFDAIVSDISMPRMNGLQFLRQAREHDLEVPVLLVTAQPAVETAIEAIQYGAFKYLTKPVDLGQFRKSVEKAVQLHRIARVKREALSVCGTESLPVGDRAGLEALFDRALETLRMVYQPIVRANDRTLFGYEALLRSSEPALPHPGAVLDAAERLDRLDQLGRKVRSSAPAPMMSKPEAGCLFVNLHTYDLLDPALTSPDSPLAKIAARVVLEITERASLQDIQDVRERVAVLRRMGFRIAIDDLGAGYAGLTSFAALEPEIVKLDMSLIRDVHLMRTKQKLISSMTSLCKEMGMMVVAEGVESVEERDTLIDLGCDLLQGYLFAQPAPAFPPFLWDAAPANC
ncbi:MAG TPA: EAL domain-containing protein [Polyangiaceae bacterium]|jgi:EAL domain-containing protein (putative c-di-GMP-specific phosphodiesterase class I)